MTSTATPSMMPNTRNSHAWWKNGARSSGGEADKKAKTPTLPTPGCSRLPRPLQALRRLQAAALPSACGGTAKLATRIARSLGDGATLEKAARLLAQGGAQCAL